jgi:hypothetical protein
MGNRLPRLCVACGVKERQRGFNLFHDCAGVRDIMIESVRSRVSSLFFVGVALVALLPLLCGYWALLWANNVGNPLIWGTGDAPQWWHRLGLDVHSWINAGLLPGIVCGMVGLCIILIGIFQKRIWAMSVGMRVWTMSVGAWCCTAAPVIFFYYMVLTF